jgi:hypothetical protein
VIYLPQGDCPGKKTGSGVFRLSENRELKEIKVKMKNEKRKMKNEKLKRCPLDGCLTASGGDFDLPPQVV